VILAQRLTKHYGPVTAVEDVSFEVRKGEVVGFLGPNGAGKTTTMKILTGYLFPDRGEVRVGGVDLAADPLAVKRRIGYLPETTPLLTDMRVDQYLGFVGEIRGLNRRARREALARATETCGLHGILKKGVAELSRGYRQRVGLAQALLHDPDILILDEPTSGLDPNQIVEIRDLIRRLGREKTVLLSTHILPEARETCGRLLIIHRGKIVADGAPDELAARYADEKVLSVGLRGSLDGAAKELGKLAGVRHVREIAGSDATRRFEVRAEKTETVEERIFDLAASRGWKLVEIHPEGATLEDLFRRLTTGEGAP
jgi:ABC-2 type transport system ATP-binding protein